MLRFSVQDTGIGLTPKQQERLFEPFSQADSSTTRRFGGAGLGLSICKRLAELMNGSIGLSSEAGRGSTFWFEVRVGIGTADSTGMSSAAQPQARQAEINTDSFSVDTAVFFWLTITSPTSRLPWACCPI